MNKNELINNKSLRVEIIPEEVEGGYVVQYPDLPGCISAGNTIEEALNNLQEAKKSWADSMADENGEITIPQEYLPEYSGKFKLRLPKSLHRRLSEDAKREGVSMNQYCLYKLAQ